MVTKKQGEMSRPMIIGLVSIAAIAFIILLITFSDVFVGQAVFVAGEGNAGMKTASDTVGTVEFSTGIENTLYVTADIGGFESVALKLELDMGDFDLVNGCDSVSYPTDWGDQFLDCEYENKLLVIRYATLNYNKAATSEFDMFGLTVKPIEITADKDTFLIRPNEIDVLDLNDVTVPKHEDLISSEQEDVVYTFSDDPDGDGIEGADDICPYDATNQCAAAGGVVECTAVGQEGCNTDSDDGILVCNLPNNPLKSQCSTKICAEIVLKMTTELVQCGEDGSCAEGTVCSVKGNSCYNPDDYTSFPTACLGISAFCEIQSGMTGELCAEGEGGCQQDDECAAGLECTNNICTVTSTAELEIDVFDGDIKLLSTATLSTSKEYTIRVTINPKTDLPANHLVIAVINYDKSQKVQFTNFKPTLSANGQEVLEFKHKPLQNGGFDVVAWVWQDFLKIEEDFTPLISKVEKQYGQN